VPRQYVERVGAEAQRRAGQHLVQDEAQPVHVGARHRRAAEDDLGSRVPGVGEPAGPLAVPAQQAGHPVVGDPHVPGRPGDEHIGRFDVAVHDADLVGGGQRLGGGGTEPGGQRRRESAEVDQVPAQVAALDEFHRERDLAALVEDLADPDVGRVHERGQHGAFPIQPVQDVPIPAEAGIEDFHRKQLAGRAMGRTPHGAVGSTADQLDQFVRICQVLHVPANPHGTDWAMAPAGDCRHNTSGSERPYSSTRRYRSQEPGDVNQQFRR
jgi:hypothetical protein